MLKPESLETPVEAADVPPQVIFAPPTPLSWRIAILVAITAIAAIAFATGSSSISASFSSVALAASAAANEPAVA